jgi:hypothetical protein
MGVSIYGLAESRSEYGCNIMDWLYLGQYAGVMEWAGCI